MITPDSHNTLLIDHLIYFHVRKDLVRDLLRRVVNVNVLFKAYAPSERDAIVSAFSKLEVPRGRIIVKQGELGDDFFAIESGTVEILLEKEGTSISTVVGRLSDGECFGELALLYGTPRAGIRTEM
jgi:CRP-like cAMP-binding protein